jgi:tellurite resistance protein TehA-like permease
MNKAQRIIVIVGLILMAFIWIAELDSKYAAGIITDCVPVALIGAALFILVGSKKKKSDKTNGHDEKK